MITFKICEKVECGVPLFKHLSQPFTLWSAVKYFAIECTIHPTFSSFYWLNISILWKLENKLFWKFFDKDNSRERKLIKLVILQFSCLMNIKGGILTTSFLSELLAFWRLRSSNTDLTMLTSLTLSLPKALRAYISVRSWSTCSIFASSRSKNIKKKSTGQISCKIFIISWTVWFELGTDWSIHISLLEITLEMNNRQLTLTKHRQIVFSLINLWWWKSILDAIQWLDPTKHVVNVWSLIKN